MTTTPNKQNRGIPRWVWVAVALVVVGALVVGVSVVFSKNREPTATPTPSPAPSAATAGADGCIAGRDNDAESLIAGAHKQSHTDAGAAATAAGFLRFIMQYPWPSERDLTSAFEELSTAKNGQEAAMAAKDVRSNPGPKTARTAGSSFADARYIIEPASTPEQVEVSIAAQAVTDGTLNGSATAMTFTMVWDNDTWKFDDSGEERGEKEILSNGVAFVGGC